MVRIIKAPNVNKEERPYRIVERDKVLRHIDDEIADMMEKAQEQESEILRAAAEQADFIAQDAEQQAQEILARAQEEGEQAKEQARTEGKEEGLNQGLQEARQQVSGVVQDLKKMMVQGQKVFEGMIQDQETEIRKLVSEITGRVIQQKIDEDDEVVVRVAEACLRQAADRQHVRVLIHPDDRTKVEEWAPEFSQIFDDIEKLSIETDPRVKRGGVIIESGAGGVDGRIDKQIEILDDTLMNS